MPVTVQLEKCLEPVCGLLFEVEYFSRAFGEEMASGKIECPHCGKSREGNPNSIYVTRKFSENLENRPEANSHEKPAFW